MAYLSFDLSELSLDLSNAAGPRQISLAFGQSHNATRWVKQQMTFEAFAKMLAKPAVGDKNGPCYTPATFKGESRGQGYAIRIDIAVLDSDAGHTLDEIKAAIQPYGWKAVIHSTYSHLSDETVINGTAYERWLEANPDRAVADFLAAKKGLLPRIVQDARIMSAIRADGDYVVTHAPCPRFRIILPLQKPWIADEFPNQAAANAAWRERMRALVHALGLRLDQSCTDTARLFYLPRTREHQEFVYALLQGDDCPIWTLPAAPAAGQPEHGIGQSTSWQVASEDSAEPFDLMSWAVEYAERFEIWTAINDRVPHLKAPRTNGVKGHVVGPFQDEHSNEDVCTGTFVVNASQLAQAGLTSKSSGFVVCCMHSACSGRDRLDYVRKMLDDGILTVGDLTAPEFLIPESEVDIAGLLANREAGTSGHTHGSDGIEPANGSPESLIGKTLERAIAGDFSNELPAGIMESRASSNSWLTTFSLGQGGRSRFLRSELLSLLSGPLQVESTLAPQTCGLTFTRSVWSIAAGGKMQRASAPNELSSGQDLADIFAGRTLPPGEGCAPALKAIQPSCCLLDEFGKFIGKVNARNAGGHEFEILTTMTELYTSASEIRFGDEYADQKARPRIDLHQPHLCYLRHDDSGYALECAAIWRSIGRLAGPNLGVPGTRQLPEPA